MDRENVISNLEQQIRWIEEIECHQFPGWLNVTNAMRDAIAMLKEQEQTINALESDLKETLQVLGEKGRMYEQIDDSRHHKKRWDGGKTALS